MDLDDALYDEFGNYIGPEDDGSSDEENEEGDGFLFADDQQVQNWLDDTEDGADAMDVQDGDAVGADASSASSSSGTMSTAIILPEDKKHYNTAEEVFGPGVETKVEDEDRAPITEAIIAPIKTKNQHAMEEETPETTYEKDYMAALMAYPQFVRNVVLLGALHHGKTALMDLLVSQCHPHVWDPSSDIGYTDHRVDEQQRQVSLKAAPMSLVLPSLADKHYLLHLMDTPGHVNFTDEVTASLRLADGAILVVDAIQGVQTHTAALLRHALSNQLAVTVLFNKMDRLILELKIPPNDAYHKLRHMLEDLNEIAAEFDVRFSPTAGNVAFGSGKHAWCFTLDSFAQIYAGAFGEGWDTHAFAKRLWGDVWFDEETRRFRKKRPAGGSMTAPRTFVHFILNPLYKLYSQVVGEDPEQVLETLAALGMPDLVKKHMLNMDTAPLLKIILSGFFGGTQGLVSMLVDHVPSAQEGGAAKVEQHYQGALDGSIAEAMMECNPRGPLMIQVTKMFEKADCTGFDAFGRVMSGTVHVGDRVQVLGQAYSPQDPEDMAQQEVTNLWVHETRYRVGISHVPAGNWVLIEGIDASIAKTATVTNVLGNGSGSSSSSNSSSRGKRVGGDDDDDQVQVFRPLAHINKSVVKVAIEPINPSELPKVLEALRKINKSYPLVETKVEESGEHVVLGTGELYMDCVLHDLRVLYAEVEIKVADPIVKLCETVEDSSSIKCYAESNNKRNKLSMIAEPLEVGLAEDIESGAVSTAWGKARVKHFFQERYQWDALAAGNVWAFGPESNGANVLINDTLPGEVSAKKMRSVQDTTVQGFQWATREGPLCDEPIRNVKFRIVDATIADEPLMRAGGHIIPTARRVTYASFLTATPRLMEPVYFVEIECPADCVSAVYNVLGRRRGHVTRDAPKDGTPLYTVHAYVPVLDSFGFETDLRSHTQGQAFATSVFDHWSMVPGDPLDKDVVLRPLEPAGPGALARELTLKTRRRKGLADEVDAERFTSL